ncbi:MAG TPA: 4-(cytidine 5'-diphospho)-2-C-methyl-D-erythritol kinase [Nocardioidaceae bacterium]|nr:4-(cytidine 5'-diphospho)-2-C-methyl-D-erythritol kinase [Nocardioidaceae bacterium]
MSAEVAGVAPAKINLCLGVGAPRPDGFHSLATVYQAIGLYDEVRVRPASECSVTVSGDARLAVADVPTDSSNIAVRAAGLLAAHHGLDAAVAIHIVKGIPVAGGMAGGSADAAATLVACDALWGTATPFEELAVLAGQLGSDVPFALLGETAVGSGHGELVTPLETQGEYWWAVLESPAGLSTPAVYRELDRLRAGTVAPEPEVPAALLEALRQGDVDGLGAALANDLQPAAFRLRPELERNLTTGRGAAPHGALLSGSGPSCLFLCESPEHAAKVVIALGSAGLESVSVATGPVPGARVVS